MGEWGVIRFEDLETRTKAMKLRHIMNGPGKRGVERGPGRPPIHTGSIKLG